ncbi:thiazole biosynthesis protein ThiF [Geomonas limicola]|uniref:Thiazole biosynthesis protein ThiF n=1 Tax=Geomonas limicola TaxID=2740186 RepID=A0A6V8N5V3_9BACT|nr:ThiF family adenylyltransferase [Geomonas limicola]GFO67926.1 thiazole biosynthesis protein ThiF [Geomonas limicola]
MQNLDTERYARQLPLWGEAGQERLARAAVLVAGVGGLGATLSQILVRAGVGQLYLVDQGTVALSDLQRQSLYAECDLGRVKVEVARERLLAIDSSVTIEIDPGWIEDGFQAPGGIVAAVDCLDNFASRFALYRALPARCYFLHGGVEGGQGQLLTLLTGSSQPFEEICAGCRQPVGAIPVAPESVFVLAGLMAGELFRCLAGNPRLLDRFLVVDLAALTLSFLDV